MCWQKLGTREYLPFTIHSTRPAPSFFLTWSDEYNLVIKTDHKSPHYAIPPVTCHLVTHTNLSQISSLCQSTRNLSPPTLTPIYQQSPHYANPTVTCRLVYSHKFITNLLIMPIHKSPVASYTHNNLSQISLCPSTSHLSPRNSQQFITNLLIMPIHQSPVASYTHINLSQISSLCQSISHLSPPTLTPIYHKSPHYANPPVTCRLLHSHQFITNLLIMPIH